MARTKGIVLNLICILLLASVFQVFFILSLAFFRDSWLYGWYLAAVIGGSTLNLILTFLEIYTYVIKKDLFYKSMLTAYILLALSAVVLYFLLKTGFFEIVSDEVAFKEYLESAGSWMGGLFVLLQFLQVVVLPIPSFVTVAAGTALFGPLRCALFSLAGILLGSITAFLIGRYVGYRAVAWIIGEETLDKWLKKIKGRDKLFLSAMFLLPIFPDDVLCFVAGISSMSLPFFLAVIVVSRVLAIFTTCYSVSFIPFNTWWGLLLWGLFFVGVIILFIFLYKKSDAIQAWFERKFHRETRVKEKKKKGDFEVQIIAPDGSIVEKGVSRREKSDEND